MIGEHRRAVRAERRHAQWRSLWQHQEVEPEPIGELEVALEPLGVGRVDPQPARGPFLGFREERLHDLARGLLLVGGSCILEVRDDPVGDRGERLP